MNKSLLNEFKAWFDNYKRQKKKTWNEEECEIMFFQFYKNFERLLKKTERDIDTKIDKEITSKKKDRATVNKAIRLSKGQDSDAKYISLRFEDMCDEANESILEPYIFSATQQIIKVQNNYEKTLEQSEIDETNMTFEEEAWRKDPRFKDEKKKK